MEINETMTFEAALARLEEIVRMLEGGSAPLDDSLKIFEEGVALVRFCGTKLDNAEQKLKILVKKQDGGYAEQPFTKTE